MAVHKRKNRAGKLVGYTVVLAVPDPTTGKKVRRVIGRRILRKDADQLERETKIAIQNGTFQLEPPTPPAVVRLEDAVSIWFETKKQSIQPNTAATYKSAIDGHVVPDLGEQDIASLTHDALQAQVNQWRSDGMGARLLHLCVMVVRCALARQVKNGTISANVAEGIEKPSARTRKPFTIWSDEQIGIFLDAAEKDRLAPLWFLTLIEGMRRGEALGLRWRDLQWSDDESACIAHIQQTVVPDLGNGGAALVQPRAKTKGSQRAVMLTSPTIAVLKAHRDRQRFERERIRDEAWRADDAIVTTTIGSVVTPSSVKRSLEALIAKADLPPVTLHTLRHMSATAMLKAGVSPALVALKLGHSDIGTTVDLYGHLTVADQSSANAALEAAVARGRDAG